MRLRIAFAVAVTALCAAPVARAASLPDLPGMATAQKATGGGTLATPSGGRAATPASAAQPAVKASASAPSATSADLAKPIRALPGGAVIPALSGRVSAGLSSSRTALPIGPDGLVVIAALGSFAALGALYLLRRLGRI